MTKDFFISDHKIYDSLHGFIRFDEIERDLIDSLAFQRLHDTHQLGVTYLVYPGATHSRFEHALGVMELSSQIFDTICKFARPDVFHFVPREGSVEFLYWKKILRLAALCHDLGHGPFSHAAERELLGSAGHEQMTFKLIQSPELRKIWDKLQKVPIFSHFSAKRDVVEDLCKISLGEKALPTFQFSAWERVVSSLISGDFFGADRIDYLLRDAQATGVVHGSFDYEQLIESMRILPSVGAADEAYEIGIDANGIESCEALLLSRYFMHRRVYQHPTVKACNFHLKGFFKKRYAQGFFTKIETFLEMDDTSVMHEIKKTSQLPSAPGYLDARGLLFRNERFKAVSVPPTVTIERIDKELVKRGIQIKGLGFERNEDFLQDKDLDFPVAKHHLTIKKAKEFSSLLANVPPSLNDWIFVSKEFEIPILEAIEHLSEELEH